MRNHFLRAGRVANLPSGGGSSIIDTDLYVHYDFSDTNCWNRTNGTNTDDYTIHNLANDYNDGLLRSRTGSGNTYRDASDSPCIDFNTDGDGCIESIPSNHDNGSDDFDLIIRGTDTNNTSYSPFYNVTAVSATDSNNVFNGVGTGAYTKEIWYRAYLDHSKTVLGTLFGTLAADSSNGSLYNNGLIASPGYTSGYWSTYANKIRLAPFFSNAMTIAGVPSSGAAWSDWNHFVYSRNSSSTDDTKIYVNNSLDYTGTDSRDYSHLKHFSMFYVSSSSKVPMRLGIFRFYRGKALTSSEVTTNWNAQKSRFGH
jgi:hypothetical protein